MQYKPGEDDGGDRIEIDVVGSHDSAQLLEHPVPCQETQHGGHTAKEQQIPDKLWLADKLMYAQSWPPYKIRYHGQQPVKEYFARNEHSIILEVGRNDQQAVHSPAERCTKGQGIASWRQMEHKVTIHHHQCYTHSSHQRAHRLSTIQTLRFVEETYQGCGYQGTHADNERCVGGCSVVHGAVLRQEIHRATSES